MIDLNDVLVLLGLALVLTGAWMLAPACAVAVFGGLLAVCGAYRARKG